MEESLKDYSKFVGKVKEGLRAGKTRRDSIIDAVKYCLSNEIMTYYLESHSEEVFNMLTMQWDKDLAMKASFDDGFSDGFKNGERLGRNSGLETVAINMLRRGQPIKDIQIYTQLPLKRIEELANMN